MPGLREGTLDIEYSPDNGLRDVDDLVVEGGVRTTLPIVVRHDHPLAAASLSPADLEGQNLVVYAAGADDDSVLDRLGAKQRARVHRAMGAPRRSSAWPSSRPPRNASDCRRLSTVPCATWRPT
ncbi:LysR substrate-binding domain-containing protein [Streptomyces kanamyceticus]|uniref:LysR substrate-binding domain-containing protein n=1 Tax=Streptomyces kanamyceticus TaxID=1967 RepID=UPI0037DD4D69